MRARGAARRGLTVSRSVTTEPPSRGSTTPPMPGVQRPHEARRDGHGSEQCGCVPAKHRRTVRRARTQSEPRPPCWRSAVLAQRRAAPQGGPRRSCVRVRERRVGDCVRAAGVWQLRREVTRRRRSCGGHGMDSRRCSRMPRFRPTPGTSARRRGAGLGAGARARRSSLTAWTPPRLFEGVSSSHAHRSTSCVRRWDRLRCSRPAARRRAARRARGRARGSTRRRP